GTPERAATRQRVQLATQRLVQMGEPEKAARAALQMGDRFKQEKEYPEALGYYKQAMEVESLPGSVKADILNALALVYAELYKPELAKRAFTQALDLARGLHDTPAQLRALSGLAQVYHQQGDRVQALSYIEQARQLNDQRESEAEADLLCLFGQIHLEEGLAKEAKAAFEEALPIYVNADNIAGQVTALCGLSGLALQAAQKSAALELAERALGLANKHTDRAVSRGESLRAWDLQWRAFLSHARAERALGEKDKARHSYMRATSLLEVLWWGWAVYSATESAALALREAGQAAYREYVDLLMELEQFPLAYERADMNKGRTILNRIEARRVAPPSVNNDQAAEMSKRSKAIAAHRLQLLEPNLSPEHQAKLRQLVEDEEFEYQKMQLDAEVSHSKEKLVWSDLASPEQLQKQTAQSQTALAEFLLGENRSYVWLFAHGKFSHATLPPRREIEQAVRAYLDLIAEAPAALALDHELAKVRAHAEKLFVTLLGPLAEQIEPGQRLIVVADGLLHYLPFGALMHKGRYLIEDHEIINTPSASMLGLWQKSASHAGGEMELLIIGDPVFEPTYMAGAGKRVTRAVSQRSRRLPATDIPHFSTLPRTRDEVEYIAGLFPAERRKVLLGRQSTEAAFKHEPLKHYRRLHFATHSLIDEKTPARSAVVLTAGDAEDGLLDVSEISQLDLDCDLVVVSACQTGRGQLLSGEGIVGLSRAFLNAGARTVVVSLWNVSDGATDQLMKDFYAKLRAGLSNAAALRQAKLRMIASDKALRHPYYWSSFVMVGKP
ncbi:MAG: CHAT domain-containing protein, partial [Blastocatellia bacterium]